MMGRIDAIATDLDRTFTDTRLRPVPSAMAALREVRRTGRKTILVTGRTHTELRRKAGLLGLFDYLIAEGGALLGTPQTLRPLAAPGTALASLASWLREEGVLFYRGVASLSVARADLPIVQRFAGVHRLLVTPNRNRADITPPGVNKGSALRALLRTPSLRRARVLGFGDGENDLPFFRALHWSVAVPNAVPAVRAHADDVARFPGGRGVADYLRRTLLAAPTPEHRVIKARRGLRAAWTRSSNSTKSRRSSEPATAARSRPSTGSR